MAQIKEPRSDGGHDRGSRMDGVGLGSPVWSSRRPIQQKHLSESTRIVAVSRHGCRYAKTSTGKFRPTLHKENVHRLNRSAIIAEDASAHHQLTLIGDACRTFARQRPSKLKLTPLSSEPQPVSANRLMMCSHMLHRVQPKQ